MKQIDFLTTRYCETDAELLECIRTYGTGYYHNIQRDPDGTWIVGVFKERVER